ncbi:MAG: putative capsid protein [Circoviridae sp.]|nr:MAG: putative capsid protein [Circoviridae sp.]
MPRVTFNRMTKKRASSKRRRTSTLSKAKYLPKSTYANRKLIKSNAYAIRALKAMQPPAVFTDYQYTDGLAPFIDSAPAPYFTIRSVKLMEPNLWNPVLRQDPNVLTVSSTMVKRMAVNLRYTLGASDWCQITCFIVSQRKDAADRVIGAAGLTEGNDYIYSRPGQNFNPRLNPAVMKVHYVRHVTLVASAWLEDKTIIDAPGGQGVEETLFSNAKTTFAKGQVNLKLNFKIRQPTGTRWPTMLQEQLSPSQRLSLLVFFRGSTSSADDNPPRLDFDALYTCYNSG